MFSNNHGACINKSTNKRPLVNYNSESESTSGRFKDDNRQFSSYQTLKKIYRPLYKNKVRVFSNLGTYVENHIIVEFFPFKDMLEERKKGWQEFVEFLLHRQNFINDVSKNNSSLISGIMYAEGWRKAQVSNQIVGRYINQNKLNHQMTIKGYLKEQSIPSLSKMNYNQKENYCPDDFSSAITYTINDFCNKAHVDNDTDNWTLIGFIPIRKSGDLAFEDFDVEGGEFVIRDLKVFIDLQKVKGITLVVLKTNKLKHQAIPSKSTSGLFTRFGLSCQISKNMSIIIGKVSQRSL
ncbi:hypothetical protein PPACK8108_LOCUS7897 [Phakopsora pachyrhizi]|uniref:Tet-like 2OG-Fe(II) oxygenase domain-containing protein n=1 Tax=Phakopsora pachyrhizi TaxID=170000 RepID=A0AAV0ATT3_PHAPC|nr:hypothetical protein PPACK8108_LOCUS7897 [Phakopsora pachyrhizi]